MTMILTDFSKAFDRIDHNILIRKLVWLNVRPCVISLIVDFLHHRQQVVKYKGCISDVKNNNAGVPQGTKLGPVLFLIMINDACNDCPFPFYKYVDDLTILESRHYNQQSQMQPQINSLETWSLSNNMKLNPKKCIVMTISFMKRPIQQTFYIDTTSLNAASVVKVLGIYIQQNLKWDTQVKEMLYIYTGYIMLDLSWNIVLLFSTQISLRSKLIILKEYKNEHVKSFSVLITVLMKML